MTKRNRVTPFGSIEATPWRGRWMGNRGCLEAPQNGETRWFTRAWIICTLQPRLGPPAPRKYTPLFFADEVSALAAGHRPCGQCRRDAFVRFGEAWGRATGCKARATAPVMDVVLHRQRRGRKQSSSVADMRSLPLGTFIAGQESGSAYLVLEDGRVREWSDGAYGPAIVPPVAETFTLLTPKATVEVLRSGYRPADFDLLAASASTAT